MKIEHATRRPWRRSRAVAGLAALALLLAACGGDQPLTTFSDASDTASDLTSMLTILLWLCLVVFIGVQGAVLYMGYKFRVKAPEDESQLYPDEDFPDQVHGNDTLERAWTAAPFLLMCGIAVWSTVVLTDLNSDAEARPDDRIHSVTVVGQQWWWEFQYHLDDDGVADIVTAGELVLPVGEEVDLTVTSRDVIHSFWIPALNGKRDAVPGRDSPWKIEAGEAGLFPGECTEFCGLSHAYMEKWVVGISPEEWDEWAANQMTPADAPDEGTAAAAGWQVFSNNCASCHVINGLTGEDGGDSFALYDGANRLIDAQTQVSGAAPNLTHVATRASFGGGIFALYEDAGTTPYLELATEGDLNRGALEAWIVNAPALKANGWDDVASDGTPRQRGMTPFPGLTDDDVDNLVAFLMTLD